MMPIINYKKIAQENEEVFRNILRDMRGDENRKPRSIYVPSNLETEATIEAIFEKYSTGNRNGKFTLDNFSMLSKEIARITFSDVAPLSGGGGELEYLVKPDNTVQYNRSLGHFMC